MYSVIPEMLHMSRKTFDVAQRRSQALQYFSATYYQKPSQFSDILTATFQSRSQGANLITRASTCSLVFEAYAQRFKLECAVEDLSDKNPLFISTLAHNRLFNPDLPADTRVLGFAPDWNASRSSPWLLIFHWVDIGVYFTRSNRSFRRSSCISASTKSLKASIRLEWRSSSG